jgi:adenylate cyclase
MIDSLPVEEAVARGDWLLTSTSWQSDIEWCAIGHARAAGKHAVTFLDHWGNFPDRFVRGGRKHLPDEIWVGDEMALRDSTPLADSMTRREFLALLNDYFECVLGPVLEHQGEVLRFIGDAALAIFPVGERPAEACAKALAAARAAVAGMEKMNKNRARPLRFGIGLHLGEVTYGNIGTPTRIEFTVIGAAANEAARIESLCKVLGVNVLVSERVVQALPFPSWRSLGSHTLRGVGDKMELFTLS